MARLQLRKIARLSKVVLFFIFGALIASLVLVIFLSNTFFLGYQNRVFPGVLVFGVDLTGLTVEEAEELIEHKFRLSDSHWQLVFENQTIELDASELAMRVHSQRLAKQAYSLGRQPSLAVSIQEIWDSYWRGTNLPLIFDWEASSKSELLSRLHQMTDSQPVDAQFKFEAGIGPDSKGRVVAFVQSQEGRQLDESRLEVMMASLAKRYFLGSKRDSIKLTLPTKTIQPDLASTEASKLGIVEILGRGESYFYDSIPGRVHNIGLGTEKITGSLLAPDEIFSFSQAIGTVSAIFGFQKAYSIIQGKTILDDGGGVCQVSTTLYRAVLNSGLPVIERVGHSYRVGFYEQGGFLPGLDATVYPPSPDFKFKNDTGNWILIQANFDKVDQKLTFEIYGKSDSRVTIVSKPIILSTSPPPEPVYEDDSTLPEGTIKRVDTAHYGANVYFTRKVTKNDEVLIEEKISTSYIPWPARYLRGTKVN